MAMKALVRRRGLPLRGLGLAPGLAHFPRSLPVLALQVPRLLPVWRIPLGSLPV